MGFFDYFGQGGAGAPLRDSEGHVYADLRNTRTFDDASPPVAYRSDMRGDNPSMQNDPSEHGAEEREFMHALADMVDTRSPEKRYLDKRSKKSYGEELKVQIADKNRRDLRDMQDREERELQLDRKHQQEIEQEEQNHLSMQENHGHDSDAFNSMQRALPGAVSPSYHLSHVAVVRRDGYQGGNPSHLHPQESGMVAVQSPDPESPSFLRFQNQRLDPFQQAQLKIAERKKAEFKYHLDAQVLEKQKRKAVDNAKRLQEDEAEELRIREHLEDERRESSVIPSDHGTSPKRASEKRIPIRFPEPEVAKIQMPPLVAADRDQLTNRIVNSSRNRQMLPLELLRESPDIDSVRALNNMRMEHQKLLHKLARQEDELKALQSRLLGQRIVASSPHRKAFSYAPQEKLQPPARKPLSKYSKNDNPSLGATTLEYDSDEEALGKLLSDFVNRKSLHF